MEKQIFTWLGREFVQLSGEGRQGASEGDATSELFQRFDIVLNIFSEDSAEILDQEIQALIDARQEARRRRDFGRADELRDDLLGRGIVLEDTKDGVRWKKR